MPLPVIWKYKLDDVIIDNAHFLEMPSHQILSVQEQHNVITIWALVVPGTKLYKQKFFIFGTGQDIEVPADEPTDFLATVQMGNGLVWHIFKKRYKFTPEELREHTIDTLKQIFPDKTREELDREIEEKEKQQKDMLSVIREAAGIITQ